MPPCDLFMSNISTPSRIECIITCFDDLKASSSSDDHDNLHQFESGHDVSELSLIKDLYMKCAGGVREVLYGVKVFGKRLYGGVNHSFRKLELGQISAYLYNDTVYNDI